VEGISALGRVVVRLVTLTAFHLRGSQRRLLGFSTPHTLAPKAIRTWFQVLSHQCDDSIFAQRELDANGLEGCAVLPSHFDVS
jgi:hypothetical protein